MGPVEGACFVSHLLTLHTPIWKQCSTHLPLNVLSCAGFNTVKDRRCSSCTVLASPCSTFREYILLVGVKPIFPCLPCYLEISSVRDLQELQELTASRKRIRSGRIEFAQAGPGGDERKGGIKAEGRRMEKRV